MEVVTRRTGVPAEESAEREHIVEGLVKALSMIDKVIEVIRRRRRRRRPAALIKKPFAFSEIQANTFST